jgi:hypothetical protein
MQEADHTSEIELLDFLYADHERVASFLAQIDGQGALKTTEETGTKSKSETAKGGLNLGVVSVGGEGTTDWQKDVRRTFDPLWINSRRLIDHFRKKVPGSTISVGQARILSGTLLAYDHSTLNSFLKSPATEALIASGMPDDDSMEGRSTKAKGDIKNKLAAVLREMLQNLGLGVGFVLVTEEAHFWFTVKKQYLSLYDLDVPLKFPIHISGLWSVLGVVDAVPNDHIEGLQEVLAKNIEGLLPPMVLNMTQLIGTVAAQFGRPIQAHGLSPLIVFREVR